MGALDLSLSTLPRAFRGSVCAGAVKVIACIEDPVVIAKLLAQLQGIAAPVGLGLLLGPAANGRVRGNPSDRLR